MKNDFLDLSSLHSWTTTPVPTHRIQTPHTCDNLSVLQYMCIDYYTNRLWDNNNVWFRFWAEHHFIIWQYAIATILFCMLAGSCYGACSAAIQGITSFMILESVQCSMWLALIWLYRWKFCERYMSRSLLTECLNDSFIGCVPHRQDIRECQYCKGWTNERPVLWGPDQWEEPSCGQDTLPVTEEGMS